MFQPITFKDFIDFLSFILIHVIQAAFVFYIYFFPLDSFACILQALANRWNIQPKKYLHFDIVTNQQEFDRI